MDLTPILTVSAPNAKIGSTVEVDLILSLPTISLSSGIFHLPTGYSAAGFFAGTFGYNITFSADIDGTANANFTFLPLFDLFGGWSSFLNNGNTLGLLSFNADLSVYSVIPTQDYTIESNGQISVFFHSSTFLVLANFNASLSTTALSNAGSNFWLAANSTANFILTQGNNAVLQIKNLIAEAGVLTVKINQEDQNETNIAIATGRKVISQIINFSHSLGPNAVTQATLVYDTTFSVIDSGSFDINSASWYKYDPIGKVWMSKSSIISGALVSYTTTSFSDWSVQGNSGDSNSDDSMKLKLGLGIGLGLLGLAIIIVLAVTLRRRQDSADKGITASTGKQDKTNYNTLGA